MKKQIALLIVLATAASSVLMAGPVDSSKEVTATRDAAAGEAMEFYPYVLRVDDLDQWHHQRG